MPPPRPDERSVHRAKCSIAECKQAVSFGSHFSHSAVDADSVSRYVTGGLVINPNPPKYTVDFERIENLELTTTAGRDHIRVHATTSGETIINGGAGGDVLTTTPTGKNMELVRDLTFYGEAGVDEIVINDQNNPYRHATLSNDYAVSASQVARSAFIRGFTASALSPTPPASPDQVFTRAILAATPGANITPPADQSEVSWQDALVAAQLESAPISAPWVGTSTARRRPKVLGYRSSGIGRLPDHFPRSA